MIWFTSDHHFGHRNIINLCARPFETLHDMHAQLTDNWNSVVSDGDIVYHLGDLTFHKNPEIYTEKLNGQIVLVKGNHDPKDTKFTSIGIPVIRKATIKLAGQIVNMSHFPYKGAGDWTKDERGDRLDDNGLWLLHGHVHEKWRIQDKMINVSVEQWDYTPVAKTTIEWEIQRNE